MAGTPLQCVTSSHLVKTSDSERSCLLHSCFFGGGQFVFALLMVRASLPQMPQMCIIMDMYQYPVLHRHCDGGLPRVHSLYIRAGFVLYSLGEGTRMSWVNWNCFDKCLLYSCALNDGDQMVNVQRSNTAPPPRKTPGSFKAPLA